MSKPLFGGERAWPAFEPVNDTVRGGASTSSWTVDSSSNIGTFSGHLDITALGGAGFASQSATFEPPLRLGKRSCTTGLLVTFLAPPRLSPKGAAKPHKLVVALKEEKPTRRPDGRRESVTVYQYTIDLDDYRDVLDSALGDDNDEEKRLGTEEEEKGGRASVTVLAKWDQFKPTYRGRPKEDADPLDPEQIYELSFMCRSNFGEQAGDFSFDLVSLAVASPSRPRGLGTWFRRFFEAVMAPFAWTWNLVAKLFCEQRGSGGGAGEGAIRLP